MTRTCIVKGCTARLSNADDYEFLEGGKKMSFHRFPAKKELLKLWCTQLKIEPTDLKLTSTVCCRHFSEEMFGAKTLNSHSAEKFSLDIVKLKKSAYPDINLGTATEDSAQTIRVSKKLLQPVQDPLSITRVPRPRKEIDEADLKRRRAKKTAQQKIRRLSSSYDICKKKLKLLERESKMRSKAAETLGKLYASRGGRLIENQVRNLGKQSTGTRYDEDILTFAYSIYKESRAAYDIIRAKLILPNPSTLRKYANLINNAVPENPELDFVAEDQEMEDRGDVEEDMEDMEGFSENDLKTQKEEDEFKNWLKEFSN